MNLKRSEVIDNDRIEQKNDEFFSPRHIEIKTCGEKENSLDLSLEQMIENENDRKKE